MVKAIFQRKLSEKAADSFAGLADPFGVLGVSSCLQDVLSADPFADDADAVIQVIGSVDGKAVGSVRSIPLDVVVFGRRYKTAAGCEMFVSEEYRNTQYGLKLPMARLASTPNNFMVGASQSQMMIKVSEFIRSTIFYFPRRIMLFDSRAIVEQKVARPLWWLVRLAANVCLKVYWNIVGSISTLKNRGLSVCEIMADDAESLDVVAKMISADKHSCFEVHNAGWIKWHMTVSLSNQRPLRLWLVKKGDLPYAFYMTKERFYEQASHRGFKNVRLVSIVEWGCIGDLEGTAERQMRWILLGGARRFCGVADAVEILATDIGLDGFLRNKLWPCVGQGNFVFKVGKGSPLEHIKGIYDRNNWRLRPAMGDAGLS